MPDDSACTVTLTLRLASWAEAALSALPRLALAGAVSLEEIHEIIEATFDAGVEMVEDDG